MKRLITWFPAFAVGVTGAAVAHLATGMLLFEDDGVFRALTIIHGMEWGALALGLGGGVRPESVAMDSLRRRWILLLFSFSIAAGFTVVWTLGRGFGGVPAAQGAGLALLGGLPLYSAGLVLRAMSAVSAESVRPFGVAGPAALGASTGVLITGTIGIARIGAPSLVLFALMLLSGGALIQGWLVEEAPVIQAEPTPIGMESEDEEE